MTERYLENTTKVHLLLGFTEEEVNFARKMKRGRNVVAICGPSGTGKSELVATIMQKLSKKCVFAPKDTVRPPKLLELIGEMPYRQISLWDIATCDKPQLVSMNVRYDLRAKIQWIDCMKQYNLASKGVIIPEDEEIVCHLNHFLNRYDVCELIENQQDAEKNGQMLMFEISIELEEDLRKIFPEMTVIRLDCGVRTRIKRILEREQPKTYDEIITTSLKVLDSASTGPWPPKTAATDHCMVEKNHTMLDFVRIRDIVSEIQRNMAWTTLSVG